MTGAYRKLIVRPEKLTWQLVRHATDTDNLIRSDLEELRGEPGVETTEDGALRSLLVQFELPSSTYATMVLREILKEDTSSAYQAKLGQQRAAAADAKPDEEKEDGGGGAEKRKLSDDEDEEEEDVDDAKKTKLDEGDASDDAEENDE